MNWKTTLMAAFATSTAVCHVLGGAIAQDMQKPAPRLAKEMSASLSWQTDKESAFEEAIAADTLIFMIGGRETCGNTIGTRDYSCEDPKVRGRLANYVLWFCNCDEQGDLFWRYVGSYGSVTLPLVCIINPKSDTVLARATGYLSVDKVLALLDKAGPPPGHDSITVDLDDSYSSDEDGSFTLSLSDAVESFSTPKITVKGLPAGLKYDAKTMTVSGKATKPGVYEVTVSATNATVKKPVTATFEIVVPNLKSDALPNLMPETDAYGTVQCGVAFDPGLVDCSPEDGWIVKVAGLPAGLKYDAKTGKITGVPTKAGTFTVTFTATRGKEKETATITLATEALPDWAAGTFTGYVQENGDSTVFGPATMTVAASGKISGKFTMEGTNWTFSAASYAAVDGEGFLVDAVAKAGKATMPVEMRLYGSTSPETDGKLLVNGGAEGGFGGSDDTYIYLWRNMWKDKATSAEAKAVLAGWEGVYTLSMEDGGYASLTVGKNGDVKVAGKLADGTALSATSPFMYQECKDFFTVFTLSPSAYKGGFVYLPVGFGTERGRLDGLGDGLVWSSRNPQATYAYGEGFERWTQFTGAYYDKAKKLSDYYEALRFATEAPVLDFTFKETSQNDQGKKVTTGYAATAEAVDTFSQSGMAVSVNEKGALVVAKATKPVQDKVTKEWYYEGANDGALALSFTQATGIFKGSYTFWYDYMSAYDDTKPDGKRETYAHTSKKGSFEGILVQGEEPKMNGFYLWDATGVYEDEKTGKEKTYKYKESFPVMLLSE